MVSFCVAQQSEQKSVGILYNRICNKCCAGANVEWWTKSTYVYMLEICGFFFLVGRPYVRFMVGRLFLVSISLCRYSKTHKAQLKSLFFCPIFWCYYLDIGLNSLKYISCDNCVTRHLIW